MPSLFRLLLCLSLALLASTACRKTSTTRSSTLATPDTLIPGAFITTSGKFTHTEGMTLHLLDVTQSGTSLSLQYRSQKTLPSGGTTGSMKQGSTSISSPTAPWFIYVESPERFWCSDGRSELSIFYADDDIIGPVFLAGKLHCLGPDIPPEVILRLPPDLQKLLPPVKPVENRPSL
jgi:hypothetical protein